MADYGREIVEETLEDLGIEYEHPGGNAKWVLAPCPLHDDNSPSFAVRIDEGGWVCYAGCGSSGDLAELVSRITGEDVHLIRGRLLSKIRVDEDKLVEQLEELAGIVAEVDEDAPFDDYDPAVAKVSEAEEDLSYTHGSVPAYIIRRGFTIDTLKAWDVGQQTMSWYDKDTRTKSDVVYVVIPVHQHGELVGLVRRSVGGAGPKYRNSHMDKGKYLLGLDHLPFGCQDIVLVEGPLDAMWLYQHGYPALAVMGSTLSEEQADLLTSRFWEVTIAFDGDKAGRAGRSKAMSMLSKRMTVAYIDMPEGTDVQDLDETQLRALFSTKKYA